MKIATKSLAWFSDDPTATSFWIFYKPVLGADPPSFTYDDPHIVVPAVSGQTDYSIQIPGQLPLTEGQYALGICAFDAEGNGSDIVVLVRFFDFTAPAAPTNFRVV